MEVIPGEGAVMHEELDLLHVHAELPEVWPDGVVEAPPPRPTCGLRSIAWPASSVRPRARVREIVIALSILKP